MIGRRRKTGNEIAVRITEAFDKHYGIYGYTQANARLASQLTHLQIDVRLASVMRIECSEYLGELFCVQDIALS